MDRYPAMNIVDLIKNWHAASGKVSEEEFSKLTNLQHRLPDGDKPFLPCLLVTCGSNFLFTLVIARMRIPYFLCTAFDCPLVRSLGLEEKNFHNYIF